MGSLEGKVAIITGASRANGMGFATAKAMAAEGATVVITDIKETREELSLGDIYQPGSATELGQRAEELKAAGATVLAMPVDITDSEQIKACVERTEQEFGRVDILFNNAGVVVGVGPFLEQSESAWEISCKVNIIGTANFCKAVIPGMIERGGGAIINNASIWALKAVPEVSAYQTSKAGVVGVTKSVAVEFSAQGIRCNAIAAGGVLTNVVAGEINIRMAEGMSREEAERDVAQGIAMERLADPDEIAQVVTYLASDKASYISGAVVPIDGGSMYGL